jgi:hypothetical protein
VSDHIAYDQQRGILWAFGDQIEVAADLLRDRDERGGQLQAGALGQSGRCERIPDRAQILQLVLRRVKTLTSPMSLSWRCSRSPMWRMSPVSRMWRMLQV